MSVIAIIGHKGRMGSMLSRHWQEAGHTIRGADRGAAPDTPQGVAGTIAPEQLAEAVTDADIVVLCVPAPAIQQVLAGCPLHDGQILMDITSVKVVPMRIMEERHRGPVIGTHPLFGPASTPEDRVVALTPGTRAEARHREQVEALFACFGCRVFQTTPEVHDRGAAFVQGLNFISSAAYFASLAHREDVLPFLTPSFRRRLESARKLLTEDAAMFEAFTVTNPMTRDAVHTFRLFLDLVDSGGLHDVVTRAGYWFDRE